jgi:hypothetical protein
MKTIAVDYHLKPCPFCGIEPEMTGPAFGGEGRAMVRCELATCFANPCVHGRTEEMAARAWNLRRGEAPTGKDTR